MRLSAELARLAGAPRMSVELADGATVTDLIARVAASHPGVGGALGSALPVIAGAHASRERPLRGGEEVALLLPVAGG